MKFLPIAMIVLATGLATGAQAQDGARNTPPARRTIQIDVFGNDPCPKGDNDEIIVCARKPEADRFRIPPKLRHKTDERKDQSWVARARDIDETGRAERPNSCSAVGSGGQTGCFEKFMRDNAIQKKTDAAAAPDAP